MLEIVRSDDRHTVNAGWLKARWHFSFDHYYDPQQVQFGPLRVFNNDVVQPAKGFPMHPHANMEILTYVIDGALEHRDSTGGHGIIHTGEVQRMSAGKGIVHSEFNASPDTTVELVQIWILPEKQDVQPSYEQKQFSAEDRTGRLLPIATPDAASRTVFVGQDVTMYVSRLEAGSKVSHDLKPERRAYVFVIEGDVQLNGETLSRGDSVKVENVGALKFDAPSTAELLLLDLP
ncbi:MAG: pirin family protein [Acidobacteria bacterium]|nr:pirin family protein [Acidobacteriota bacterium]MDA1234721.1 pirin family protein [Acidobacteriota bacterium]